MSAWGNYVPTGMWPQQQQGTEQPDATSWATPVDPLMGQHWVYPSQWGPGYYGADPYGQPAVPAGYPAHPPYPPQPQPGGQSYPPQPRIVPPGGESHPKLGLEAAAGEADEDVDWEDSGDEEANVEAEGEDDNHAMAVYCKECQTWLNGPRQWEDHKIGKKHRKNVQKAKRGTAGGSSEVAHPEQKEPTPDEVPEKKTEAWNWLEEGKAQKEAEENEKKVEGPTEEKTSRSARRRRHKKEKEEREAAEAAEMKAKGEAENVPGDVVESNAASEHKEEKVETTLTKVETTLTGSSENPADVLEKKDLTVADKGKVPDKLSDPKVVPPREEFKEKTGSTSEVPQVEVA